MGVEECIAEADRRGDEQMTRTLSWPRVRVDNAKPQ